ncbi:hypothetical protein CL614_00760 [archaeon]|nr:hypothetical protein [archaeon]
MAKELIWVRLAADKKRTGELVGWVAEGEEKGKIVFIYQSEDEERGLKAGNFCSVDVAWRNEKSLQGRVHEITTLPSEDEFVTVISGGFGFPGTLDQAKQAFQVKETDVRKKRSDREDEEAKKKLEGVVVEQNRRDSVLEEWGQDGLALYDRLMKHDWYYSFSDDGGVYRRGEADRDEIKEILKVTDGAREIWDMVAPRDCRFPL